MDEVDTEPKQPEIPFEVAHQRFVERGERERYQPAEKLGTGGMGEVWVCADRRVERDVAMKIMKPSLDQRSARRFMLEAKLQARLEHPAIVPVYDIGETDEGVPFFTMKRVRGRTLREILDALVAHDPAIANEFTKHRLLSTFASTCLTIQYAHESGVLHRDLKPDNIMVGDFGEVYVLDWGVARDVEPSTPAEQRLTGAGMLLGTPAYMPPEQRWGQTDKRGDIYSLGAILYEILTLASIRDASPALDATVPPSLLSACRIATAAEPDERFASARELGAIVEHCMAGELDRAVRQRLADEHARRAEDAAQSALAIGSRRIALAEAGRALALDPDHRAGMSTLHRLLTALPTELPPEALGEWKRYRARSANAVARAGSIGMLSSFAWVPFALWMGVRMSIAYATMLALLCVSAGYLVLLGRAVRSTTRAVVVAATLSFASVSYVGLMFGPLFIVPGIVALIAGAYVLQAPRATAWITALAFGAIVVPLALEWIGLLEPSLRFENGSLVVVPRMLSLSPDATIALLLMSTAGLIVTAIAFFHRASTERAHLEHRLYLQSWQLRQLLWDPTTSDD